MCKVALNQEELTENDCNEIIRIIMDSKEYTQHKGVIMEKLYNIINKKTLSIQVRGYTDFVFNNIECMISYDKKELGFFKDENDVRPSSATYIKYKDALHLFEVFTKQFKL